MSHAAALLPSCHFCHASILAGPRVTPCVKRHQFHQACYSAWLDQQENRGCPLCDDRVEAMEHRSHRDVIIQAIRSKELSVLQAVLPQSAELDPSLRGRFMLEAASVGQKDLLDYILDAHEGELAEEVVSEAIYAAARQNCCPIVQRLLKIHPSMQGKWAEPAMMFAILWKNQELIQLLKEVQKS